LKSWKEFLHFGVVGVIGFAVDASTFAIMLMASAGVLWGRAVSYVAAASCTCRHGDAPSAALRSRAYKACQNLLIYVVIGSAPRRNVTHMIG
jgi:hypothetical protein